MCTLHVPTPPPQLLHSLRCVTSIPSTFPPPFSTLRRFLQLHLCIPILHVTPPSSLTLLLHPPRHSASILSTVPPPFPQHSILRPARCTASIGYTAEHPCTTMLRLHPPFYSSIPHVTPLQSVHSCIPILQTTPPSFPPHFLLHPPRYSASIHRYSTIIPPHRRKTFVPPRRRFTLFCRTAAPRAFELAAQHVCPA